MVFRLFGSKTMFRLFPALPFLLLVGSFVTPEDVMAETKIINAEASYTMGDGETPLIAEARVLQQAKQSALEQAGTYVESYTKVLNYDLTAQEIQTIAGGIIAVEVLKKTRRLVGDGIRFDVKIKATVTTDKMEALVQRIKGKNVAEEYETLQKEYAKLNEEIETWKQLVAKAPAGPERNAALEQIRERETAFSEVQHKETTLFKRLVSGESLVSKALSQLAEKRDEQAIVDRLFLRFLDHGFIITVGDPDIQTHLKDPRWVMLNVPVTLEITQTVRAAIEDTAQFLGGELESRDMRLHSFNRDRLPIPVLRVSKNIETSIRFQQLIASFFFVLELILDDGTTLRCYEDNGYRITQFDAILPIMPIEDLVLVTPFGLSGDRVALRYAGYVAMFPSLHFIAGMVVRMDNANKIKEIRGKIVTGRTRPIFFSIHGERLVAEGMKVEHECLITR